MSSDEAAIRVRNLSKHYLLFDRPEDRLKQSIVPRLQRLVGRPPKQYFRNFAALNDVSFEVKRGETVGIVGRNGSGKSTLLQLICGTLQPTHGTVEINGRVAALLELGAGFNPQFTGRENVYMNAAILGLSKAEIDNRFEEIARFADIGAFIEQPVKTYSSGMFVRLAFATAINVDPDILVVDEALAVGDEGFQRKCFARIEQIQDKGGTILFVSHGAQTIVQLCSRAMLFDGGELLLEGEPKRVVSHYQRLVNLTGAEARSVREEIRCLRVEEAAHNAPAAEPCGESDAPAVGDGHDVRPAPPVRLSTLEGYDPGLISHSRVEYEGHGARIREPRLLNSKGERINILEMGQRYTYEYFVDFSTEATNVGFGMLVNTTSGFGIGGATTAHSQALRTPRVESGMTARVRFEFDCCLLPGTYFLNAGVQGTADGQTRYLHRILDVLAFRVASTEELVATSLVDLGFRAHVVVFSPNAVRVASN
jgi:lipopolysaccharide transport system ATP-binding protein